MSCFIIVSIQFSPLRFVTVRELEFQVSTFEMLSDVVGWGGVVACLIIVSTSGPVFAKVKARFGQVVD